MDSSAKCPSDSELNLSNLSTKDIDWKRRRNNSAESYLTCSQELRSGTAMHKIDEVDTKGSPLSKDDNESVFLTNLASRDSGVAIDVPETSRAKVNSEKYRIRNINNSTEISCNVKHVEVSDTGCETLASKEFPLYENKNLNSDEFEIKTANTSRLDRNTDIVCSGESSKLDFNYSLSLGSGELEKEIECNITREYSQTPTILIKNCGVTDFSSAVIKSPVTQSQEFSKNKPGVATSKTSMLQTEEVIHFEEDSRESCNNDFWDGFVRERCKNSPTEDTEIARLQPSAKNIATETHSSKCSFLQSSEVASPEKHSIQKSSNKSSEDEKEISSATNTIPCGISEAGTSSPYQILEGKSIMGETIIGQPRCLALKQYNANVPDSDLDFDFQFIDDIEDDVSLNEQLSESGESELKKHPDPNDMFFNDDSEITEIQNIPYITIASPVHSGRNRESSILEKEEGELTPELISSTQAEQGESKKANLKNSTGKESNLEFFSKVNRCLFQLDKEFNNIHLPRKSKKLIGHLQDTLNTVKRMDRKLSLLIESVNNRGNRNGKYLKHDGSSALRSNKNLKGATKGNDIKGVPSSKKGTKKISGQSESHNSRSSEHSKRQGSNNQDSKSDKSSEITRVNDGKYSMDSNGWWRKESQTAHERNASRKISPSEAKKEKQRIQSLFKRQMNLITRHVVQKNKVVKRQGLKSKTIGKGSEGQLEHDDITRKVDDFSQKLPNLEEVKSLEEMEAFVQILKEKRVQTTQGGGVIDYKEKHGVLKFTTKKKEHTKWRSFLEDVTGTKSKMVAPIAQSTKTGDNVSLEKESHSENSKELKENRKGIDKEISKSRKELSIKNSQDEQMVKYNSNNPFNTAGTGSEMVNLSETQNLKEQNYGKSTMKREVGRDRSVEGIELQNGGEVNDSFLVKRNSEMECIELISESQVSVFESDSCEIIPKNSKKRIIKKQKYLSPKSSESDSQRELKDQIPKKRKRARPRSKLSSAETKNDTPSISKSQSQSRYHSNSEEEIDYSDDHLPSELKPRNLYILADKNLPLLDKHFSLKVKGNQIFLQTKEKSRSNKYKREFKSSDEETPRKRKRSRKTDKQQHFDPKDAGTTLKEMEDFLQQLRSKKKVASDGQKELLPSNHQSKEAKFMARIQAKRKAKLMACMSEAPTITEKEAKFLKDLENRAREPCDSPETMRKKQDLMQKIRAETDAIILTQKQSHSKNSNLEEETLSDVKTILNMIREAESGSHANSRQFLVSFPLKRSDMRQLENITTGKTPALSEESQKFLNSVRAKMRAKKTAVGIEGFEQKQLQKD